MLGISAEGKKEILGFWIRETVLMVLVKQRYKDAWFIIFCGKAIGNYEQSKVKIRSSLGYISGRIEGRSQAF